MPLFDFRCTQCGHVEETFQHITTTTSEVPCVKCDGIAVKQVSRGRARNAEFHTPVELYSIGCTSMDEIRAMQRAGVEISDNPNDELFGIPIARTRQQKLKALDVAGFAETK